MSYAASFALLGWIVGGAFSAFILLVLAVYGMYAAVFSLPIPPAATIITTLGIYLALLLYLFIRFYRTNRPFIWGLIIGTCCPIILLILSRR